MLLLVIFKLWQMLKPLSGPVCKMADLIANVVDVITTILQLESITIVADVIATCS